MLKSLDLDAVIKDLHALMTRSQPAAFSELNMGLLSAAIFFTSSMYSLGASSAIENPIEVGRGKTLRPRK